MPEAGHDVADVVLRPAHSFALRFQTQSLLVWATLAHAFKKALQRGGSADIGQKGTQTLPIEQCLHPRFGPGQAWEGAARLIKEKGGEIHAGYTADKIGTDGWRLKPLEATDSAAGAKETFTGDYFPQRQECCILGYHSCRRRPGLKRNSLLGGPGPPRV